MTDRERLNCQAIASLAMSFGVRSHLSGVVAWGACDRTHPSSTPINLRLWILELSDPLGHYCRYSKQSNRCSRTSHSALFSSPRGRSNSQPKNYIATVSRWVQRSRFTSATGIDWGSWRKLSLPSRVNPALVCIIGKIVTYLAAKTKQAWISSGSKSGKSAKISSQLTFKLSISKISITRIRIPRIHGIPPHWPGVWVILANNLAGFDTML